MPDFLILAAAAGIGVALMTGPLGAFVIWRRLAYFGDTLAHAALLGAGLGLFLQIQPQLAVVASSLLLGLLLTGLQRSRSLASDTLLGILSHTALAAGLVCVSLLSDARIDLYALLFGDLLTANITDILWIYATAAAVLTTLFFTWRSLLLATLDEDLAKVEGVPTEKLRLLLVTLVALVIAFAMKVVGILLITALLIIPAAASRNLSRSPGVMAIGASAIGALAVIIGLAASWFLDIPAGPGVVLCAAIFFFSTWLIARLNVRRIRLNLDD